ncbi:HPP family protein, partial [Achromobacter ruhlandii]|uniref:HPP family protein n=1 Tax=Achromobacter ruhlandii TaxID=72557 RepID=UPI00201649AD
MGVAIRRWLGAFAPAPVGVNTREKLYGAIGALLGLFCTEWVGHHALGNANPWFIAPMGACAVLLFAAPASPLAQPWPIMAGNIVSALIGVFCAHAARPPRPAPPPPAPPRLPPTSPRRRRPPPLPPPPPTTTPLPAPRPTARPPPPSPRPAPPPP